MLGRLSMNTANTATAQIDGRKRISVPGLITAVVNIMLLQTADETDLTDEVYAEHDSMKDHEEVEIEKAATTTTTSTLLNVTLYNEHRTDKYMKTK